MSGWFTEHATGLAKSHLHMTGADGRQPHSSEAQSQPGALRHAARRCAALDSRRQWRMQSARRSMGADGPQAHISQTQSQPETLKHVRARRCATSGWR